MALVELVPFGSRTRLSTIKNGHSQAGWTVVPLESPLFGRLVIREVPDEIKIRSREAEGAC